MPNSARENPQTEIDLTSIYNFIADDSVKAADAWLKRIEDSFDMLAQTPMAGRAREDLSMNLRSFPVGAISSSTFRCPTE
jgi:toxin ParE1/3/4